MAKEYNVGSRLYLPVWVTEKETNVMIGPDKSTTITDAKFSYAYWHGKTGEGKVRYGEEGLLLTATEIAENVAGRRCAECYPTYEELKSRNAELEALLNEVMATRDEAIQQNNELIAENSKLKADCNEWKDTANERLNAVKTLSAERNKVMAGVDELKNTLSDRIKDVQHLAEENDKLKAEVEDLTGQRDKYKEDAEYFHGEKLTAEDNARSLRQENAMLTGRNKRLERENASLKAERDKFAKTTKDKADLANKACNERNDVQGDLVTAREAIDYLQEENNKLKQEVENRMTDYKLMRDNNAVYLSRIATQNEVINALVEKIRRLEGGET